MSSSPCLAQIQELDIDPSWIVFAIFSNFMILKFVVIIICASLAQLGERTTEDRKVPCSIHVGGISFLPFSEPKSWLCQLVLDNGEEQKLSVYHQPLGAVCRLSLPQQQ